MDGLYYQKQIFGKGKEYYFEKKDIHEISVLKHLKSRKIRGRRQSTPKQSKYSIAIFSKRYNVRVGFGLHPKDYRRLIKELNEHVQG